jgi:hypothetical protein
MMHTYKRLLAWWRSYTSLLARRRLRAWLRGTVIDKGPREDDRNWSDAYMRSYRQER